MTIIIEIIRKNAGGKYRKNNYHGVTSSTLHIHEFTYVQKDQYNVALNKSLRLLLAL